MSGDSLPRVAASGRSRALACRPGGCAPRPNGIALRKNGSFLMADLGEINHPYLFKLIDERGYDGWVSGEYRPKGNTSDGLAWMRG